MQNGSGRKKAFIENMEKLNLSMIQAQKEHDQSKRVMSSHAPIVGELAKLEWNGKERVGKCEHYELV